MARKRTPLAGPMLDAAVEIDGAFHPAPTTPHLNGASALPIATIDAPANPEPDAPVDESVALVAEPVEIAAGEAESGNTLQTYLREIRRAPLLTPQQEFDTATRARQGDFAERLAIIEHNLRLFF